MGCLPRWGQTVARHFFGRRLRQRDGRLSAAKPSQLFLGLRDFGPWWAELYRLPGQPASYLVQLVAAPGGRPDFVAARLELADHVAVALPTGGTCLFALLPEGMPVSGGLRLVAEQRDGTILTAVWE